MKTITIMLPNGEKTYKIIRGNMPYQYLMAGTFSQNRPAFCYFTESRKILEDIELNSVRYEIYTSLKKIFYFLENPRGHQAYECAEVITEQLIYHKILEEMED